MPSVVIIGGTGSLGQEISNAFLTTFRASFPTVRILTRDPSSANAQALQSKGAEIHKLDDAPDALDRGFAGADVIVNALTSSASDELKRNVVNAAARSSARVYFLGEFGCDHRLNDFPGYEHDEWSSKRELAARFREKAKDKKAIALYNGAFLELAFLGPFLGYDVAGNRFTPYGSPKQKVSFTSKADIGKTIARLAILALDPTTAAQVPDEVRIGGSTADFEQVRDIVARVKGVEKGVIASEDLVAQKAALKAHPGENFIGYLRVLMGEGKMDFSKDNLNELVNPGESLWKWKTVEDHLRAL